MDFIANILLGAGAIGAGIFCLVLSRRLKSLSQLDSGMGGAIAVLSVQVDEMTAALGAAQEAATGSAETLRALTMRAETAAAKLELMLSSLHDLPEMGDEGERRRPCVVRRARRLHEPEVAE
ncbi:MAG: hypothetical protein H6895_02535 [Defluviimonas sp.]|uniref:hypothetical protein n=1 Tax=Albidovulum sp. TaxID=1872424 RepID=UPI002A31F093|nr:hypothetical protein [Defluviimonas sp.]